MKILLKTILFLMIFVMIHCNHNRIYFNDTHQPGETKVVRLNYYLMGLVPKRRLTFQHLCGNQGIYEVHYYTSKFDGLISCISLFTYTPRTLEVICNGERLGFKLEELPNSEDVYKIYTNKPDIKIAGVYMEKEIQKYEK